MLQVQLMVVSPDKRYPMLRSSEFRGPGVSYRPGRWRIDLAESALLVARRIFPPIRAVCLSFQCNVSVTRLEDGPPVGVADGRGADRLPSLISHRTTARCGFRIKADRFIQSADGHPAQDCGSDYC